MNSYSNMDVLCGKGPFFNRHTGNVLYRHYVKEQLHNYSNASKTGKYQIIKNVYQEVLKNGCFLEKNKATNDKWERIDSEKAIEKIGRCFRILQYEEKKTISKHAPSNAPTSAP